MTDERDPLTDSSTIQFRMHPAEPMQMPPKGFILSWIALAILAPIVGFLHLVSGIVIVFSFSVRESLIRRATFSDFATELAFGSIAMLLGPTESILGLLLPRWARWEVSKGRQNARIVVLVVTTSLVFSCCLLLFVWSSDDSLLKYFIGLITSFFALAFLAGAVDKPGLPGRSSFSLVLLHFPSAWLRYWLLFRSDG